MWVTAGFDLGSIMTLPKLTVGAIYGGRGIRIRIRPLRIESMEGMKKVL